MASEMKMSQAMRKGAAIRPKCEAAYFFDDGNVVKSCALGAALEGSGQMDPTQYGQSRGPIQLRDFFEVPYFGITGKQCPHAECAQSKGYGHSSIETIVMCLNDDCGWSREEIADWLESIGL